MFSIVCALHSNCLAQPRPYSPLWLSFLIFTPNSRPLFHSSLQADTEKARSSSSSRSTSRHRRVCINTHFCLYFPSSLPCVNPVDNLSSMFFHIAPLTAGWWCHVSQQLQGAYFPASLTRLSSYWGTLQFVLGHGLKIMNEKCSFLFYISLLKSTSSSMRDTGGRSSSRRKDGLVCIREHHMCHLATNWIPEFSACSLQWFCLSTDLFEQLGSSFSADSHEANPVF